MNATIHFTWKFGVLITPLLLGIPGGLHAQDDLTDEELDAIFEDEEALEAWLMEEFGGWDFTAFSRLGWGHSDNVLLATVNPQSGDYLRTDVELFLAKLPDENGEFFSFLTGTDIRYSDVEDADKEQLWLFNSQWKRYLSDQLTGGLSAQYVYFDQILDFSLTERQETRQRIQYHGYGVGGDLEFTTLKANEFTFGLLALREEYAAVLGNDWLGRVDLKWKRPLWKAAEIAFELRGEHRDHEDRGQRDAFGRPVAGDNLEVNKSSAVLDIAQDWGKSGNMQTALEFRFLENRDNGVGYYDYDQWSVDLTVDGEWKGLEISLALGVDKSEFLIQRAERFTEIPRKKTDYWMEFLVRKQLMKRISLYLILECEDSQSNVVEDEYNAFSGSLGFQIDLWGDS